MKEIEKLAEEAKVYLKNRGLKNPPLDSGIGGAVDRQRQHASLLMAEFSYQKAIEEQKQPALSLEEAKDEVAKRYNHNTFEELSCFDTITVDNVEEVAVLCANQFREEQKWISVDEMLPLHFEFNTIQVLTFGYDDWYIADFFEREFYCRHQKDEGGNSLNISKYITHWEYLPELPLPPNKEG